MDEDACEYFKHVGHGVYKVVGGDDEERVVAESRYVADYLEEVS